MFPSSLLLSGCPVCSGVNKLVRVRHCFLQSPVIQFTAPVPVALHDSCNRCCYSKVKKMLVGLKKSSSSDGEKEIDDDDVVSKSEIN